MNAVTPKQREFIETICAYLDVKFTGTTKQEASAFISAHINELEREQAKDDVWHSVMNENAGDR